MAFFDDSSINSQIALSKRQQLEFLNYVKLFVRTQATKVYGSGPDWAKQWVSALGTGAVVQFEISNVLATAVNGIAGLTGADGLGDVLPPGYSFVPTADGTGVLTFTAPVDPSSSSSSSSPVVPAPSSSSSSTVVESSSSSAAQAEPGKVGA